MPTISFKRPDGGSCPGYLAWTGASSTRGGVVLLHEWWGLNAHIQDLAERLCSVGFTALAPDLYKGRVATTPEEAEVLSESLDAAQCVAQDVRGAIRQLKSGGGKVAVMGFCMGGSLALRAAMALEEVDATVCFYGIPEADAGDPATIKAPFLGHFATRDAWCTPARVDALEARLNAGHVRNTIRRYEADHAFFNDTRGSIHHPQHARAAWLATVDFLQDVLA